MTKTEKANRILLAIYDKLGEDSYEKIDEMKYTFSTQISENISDDEFFEIMHKLCERKLITGEHNDFLDKDSYFQDVQLTKKGRKEGKRIMKEIKETMEAKANEILLAIYEETNRDIYEKIQYIDNTWKGGIYENDYRYLIMLLEEQGYIKWGKVDSLDSKTYITTFQDVRLTQNGKLKCESLNNNTIQNNSNKKNMDKVFIVYGHEEEAKTKAARLVENLGFKAIILHEQASSSKTIIGKIEKNSDVGFGIVLYTSCDVGTKKGNEQNLKSRVRQNVVFEHGFLMGKIGRSNVCALVKGDVVLLMLGN